MQASQLPSVIPPPPQPPVMGGIVQASPTMAYRGAAMQRTELANQLDNLKGTRSELSEELQNPMVGGANRAGLEARIAQVDQRIADVDKQLAAADLQVARAAGVPGVVQETPREHHNSPEPALLVMSGIFVLLLPLSIAMAIRWLRRGKAVIAALPNDMMERLSRLDQSVDSIAVEVERIGEGQRFLTRLLSDQGVARAIGAGAFDGIKQEGAERERVARSDASRSS